MELNFDTRLAPDDHAQAWTTVKLDFDARQRSRAVVLEDQGCTLRFALPRGTVLRGGDLLRAREDGRVVRIEALPEPVMVVGADHAFSLLKAAYHLGNRHVPVELHPEYLQFSPDPVLAAMIRQMGLHIEEKTAPFEPEAGAYHGRGHSHDHDHSHAHAH